MRKKKFALKNIAVLTLLVVTFIACDKDFATLGSDIVGQNNFGLDSSNYEVIAYSRVLNDVRPVQTNNLPLNYLGAYNDPTYGLTTASFVTQVSSSLINPDFGTNVILDSVILSVPYFSRVLETNSEGNSTYALDSIFGSGVVNLSISENTYFLRSFDPNSEFNMPQVYYSNGSTSSTNTINPALFEGTPIYQQDDFSFSNAQISLKDETGEITERLAPSLRLKLDKEFWQRKIINKQGEPELSNNNNFNNYFRGLYFKVEAVNNNGSLALLNFASSNANVTLYYTKDGFAADSEPVQTRYTLNFGNNRVNLLSNNFSLPLVDGDQNNGDEKLYLKGGAGSMAIVNLFNGGDAENGFSSEFIDFKNLYAQTDIEGKFVKAKRLINEANLVFYVDQSQVRGAEPNRIYLYDFNNNTPLIDYAFDLNSSDPKVSRSNHLGALERVGNTLTGDGIRYKIKITEHLNNLILRDSSNVKLGLVVSGNVNLEGSLQQYNVQGMDDSDIIDRIPASSIMTPRGTVLYGNNTSDESKKLYLEIFYTEPNN